MYELWTIWPANLVMTFDTAAEAEQVLRKVVDEKGLEALRNHAVLIEDESQESVAIAENGAILAELTRLRLKENLTAARAEVSVPTSSK